MKMPSNVSNQHLWGLTPMTCRYIKVRNFQASKITFIATEQLELRCGSKSVAFCRHGALSTEIQPSSMQHRRKFAKNTTTLHG